jgi:hypothetical protein
MVLGQMTLAGKNSWKLLFYIKLEVVAAVLGNLRRIFNGNIPVEVLND